ncbi:metal resistance protein ycf1 [Auriculariales sp. MPI-PUGE-AT-0066]|nr:metal resistance protein ycf1 [Auriculariales sp. MPI-PUGE-AT-0066]
MAPPHSGPAALHSPHYGYSPQLAFWRCADETGDGWDTVSKTRPFDFGLCFERARLLPALHITFAALALVAIARLSRRRIDTSNVAGRVRSKGFPQVILWSKIALLLVSMIALSVATFLAHVPSLDLTLVAVQLFAAAVIYVNTQHGCTSSTLLLIFYPLHIFTLAVAAHTDWDIQDTPTFAIHTGTAALEFIVLVIEYLGPDVGARASNNYNDKRISPLATANIYSVWSFGWLTPFMKLGAAQYITENDLYALPSEEETHRLGAALAVQLEQKRGVWSSLFRAYGPPMFFALGLKIVQGASQYVFSMLPRLIIISSDLLAFAQPQLLRLLLQFLRDYQAGVSNNSVAGTSIAVAGSANISQPAFQVPFMWTSDFYVPSHSSLHLGAVAEEFGMNSSPSSRPPLIQGFALAGLMFFAAIAQTAILHQYFQICYMTGTRIRAGLVKAIYEKTLVLSSAEKGSRASGDVVNLMSVDATRLQDLCTYGLIAFSGPFQIVLAFISLYNLLGWPAFVGVAVMVVSIPLNTFLASVQKTMQETQMKNRDQRTRAMTEVLNNIKSIKLYAWEPAFIRRVLDIRNNREMKMLKKIGIFQVLSSSLWTGIPLLVAFASFAVAGRTGQVLTSDIIFPAISLFMLLQFPLAVFAMITSNIVEALVSVKRMSSFLSARELQRDARSQAADAALLRGDHPAVLEMKEATLTWDDADTGLPPVLDGIDLTVRKGELVGVLGRVGSGKTSLLSAIVGEMVRLDGTVTVHGTIAYTPQNPWIMSGTIRDNIVFSHEFDPEFYEATLDACALRPDLETLLDGEMTTVGEKGITLSGGQRARIALARAVYARADLYLLDDVLAAVDSHVARHVFDNVIGPRGLLRDKARILVTNTVAFVRQFDNIAFMRRGIILESGCYGAVMASQGELWRLIAHHGRGLTAKSGSAHASGTATPNTAGETAVGSPTPPSEEVEEKEEPLDEKPLAFKTHGTFDRAKLLPISDTHEHTEQGKVQWKVYTEYIKAASRVGFAMFLLLILVSQAFSIGANITLMAWGNAGASADVGRYIAIYGICVALSAGASAVSSFALWVYCTLRSARELHDSMLGAVMRAPLSFFEVTPTGRIMNLFSRDIYVIDQILARVFQGFVRTLANVLAIVVVICVNLPLFLFSLPPLAYLYHLVMMYYLATSRELKRLDAVSRSPIFAWFSESLNGLSTIRAFGQQRVFGAHISRLVDANQECYILSVSVNRWLAIRLEMIGATIILVASLLSLGTLGLKGAINAGVVGLVLSYGLTTTGSLNWVVRSASEVEQNIVSVERILHYVGLEPEAPEYIEESKPKGEWPSEGKVEFRDYSLKYKPTLDPVLKNISLKLNAHEKVGIVGRTGAGKSSLLLALFRILEPANGTILIDGVDITTLGLHDLRSALSIIPQEPQLFEGTLRENVDPTGVYSDEQIWEALAQSHLKEYVQGMPGGLDAQVREGGSSLSAGQRQLLCFARALLRKSRILVLDEATSAVDLESDKAIQDILHGPQFANVTMLTIAHRLHTIMESDRVLVLDAGQVAEFDSPENLLANRDSRFYSLAAEAGLVTNSGSD